VCDVRPTPAFNWLLILLIPLTLAWKLVGRPPALHEMQGKIVRFLMIHNLAVTDQTLVDGVPIVHATRGDCHIIVAEGSPDGSMRDVMRHFAAEMDRSFVVFRGNLYDEQPTLLTVTQDWSARFLRRLGIFQAESPPIMVAATPSCEAERMPWAELSGGG
jgi:hypothetical protein